MEYLDVVDAQGEPTGEVVERSKAHLLGIRHRTSHVWLYRMKNNRAEILLQKRCATKDSFPGCYDISSAGHIPSGCSFEESAIRELEEELGIQASATKLIYCGMQSIDWDAEFHGLPYHDRQVTKVFLLRLDDFDEEDFRLQESEVESVRWMGYDECIAAVLADSIKHCISVSELEMLRDKIK